MAIIKNNDKITKLTEFRKDQISYNVFEHNGKKIVTTFDEEDRKKRKPEIIQLF